MKIRILISLLLVFAITACTQTQTVSTLSEAQIVEFMKLVAVNLNKKEQFGISVSSKQVNLEVVVDGEKLQMLGDASGEVVELYKVGGEVYYYGALDKKSDPTWIKITDKSADALVGAGFKDPRQSFLSDMSDAEILEQFKYIELTTCPDNSGPCHKFEIIDDDDSIDVAYFHAEDKLPVQIIDDTKGQETILVFDYSVAEKIELPEAAKDAKNFEELFIDQFGEELQQFMTP